jgi:hypothetical protein
MATFRISMHYDCVVAGQSVEVSGATSRLIPHPRHPRYFESVRQDMTSCAGSHSCGVLFKESGCPFHEPA